MKKTYLNEKFVVSSIGYGAMGLSEFYGENNDKNSLTILNKLLELDITFIDTSDVYGRGHNERLIGHFLAGLEKNMRDNFKVATKCGIDRPLNDSYARKINNNSEYIKKCCHESLKRLGVERIDLFYLHRVDKDIPIEESMMCLESLVTQGKIAHIGLCEVSANTLRRAHKVYPVTALQTEYSLWTRDIEDEILPTVKELGIGLVPYSPLGRGFLTGKYLKNSDFSDGDFRKNNERFNQENIDHNVRLLEIINPLANKYQCTSGQIALSWLLSQYERIVPIPGTKRIEYLIENSKASEIALSEDDIHMLNNIQNVFVVKGNRYTSEGMKGINA